MPSLNSEAALRYVVVSNQLDENALLTVQGLVRKSRARFPWATNSRREFKINRLLSTYDPFA